MPLAAAEPIEGACEVAGTQAEARYGLPAGLLLAIGRIESGRRGAAGRVTGWPWTINAEGRGHLFNSRDEAQDAVRTLQQSGVASIDIGCFQVNLAYHPDAFATVEDGFEPSSNADYAARFLASLKDRTGSWDAAVGAYHSSTPERGQPYRDRVMADWSNPGAVETAGVQSPMPAAVPLVLSMRVESWSAPAPLPGGMMRVWTPRAVGQGPTVIRIGR